MTTRRASLLDKHLYYLVYLKQLFAGGFRRRYYSQWGEDKVLEELFAAKPAGFYVDVGAYHPFHYSNTALLYKKGWRGLNIDPNPNAVRLFNWHRRRDTTVNSGVGQEVATTRYYLFNHQAYNTFSRQQRDEALKKKFIRVIGELEVLCVPLQSILKQHVPDQQIDFLNIDVEGMGLEVLRSLNWRSPKPRVVCVEDDHYEPERGSEIHTLLAGQGYRLHARCGASSIYTLL